MSMSMPSDRDPQRSRSDGLRLTASGDHLRQAVRRKTLPRNVNEYGVRPGSD